MALLPLLQANGVRQWSSVVAGDPVGLQEERGLVDGPFELRVTRQSVALVHRHTHVVDRIVTLTGNDSVLQAVMAAFKPQCSQQRNQTLAAAEHNLSVSEPRHLCVLVRPDHVKIYTAEGEILDVPLPFQASRMLAMDRGLLFQRKHTALTTRQDVTAVGRPCWFTLMQPLEEVKPVAVVRGSDQAADWTRSKTSWALFYDVEMDIVNVCPEVSLLVAFHRRQRQFCVYELVCMRSEYQRAASQQLPENGNVFKTHLTPDWIVHLLWTSSYMAEPSSSSERPGEPISASAFIASDTNLSPLMCIMDRHRELLIMKPFARVLKLDVESVNKIQMTTSSGNVRTLGCRQAVPVASITESMANSNVRDLIVWRCDGSLVLQRADHVVALILEPWISDSFPHLTMESAGLRGTPSGDRFDMYATCRQDDQVVVWSCEHPLGVFGCALLDRVWSTLQMVLPPLVLLSIQVDVVSITQSKSSATRIVSGLDYEWNVFCDYLKDMCDNERSCDADSSATYTKESAFDQLCRSEFHNLYSFENAEALSKLLHPVVNSSSIKSERRSEIVSRERFQAFQDHIYSMFAALHLLHEDYKLSMVLSSDRLRLGALLLHVSCYLGLDGYTAYYQHENQVFDATIAKKSHDGVTPVLFSSCSNDCVPDIFQWLKKCAGYSKSDLPLQNFPVFQDILLSPTSALESSPLWRTTAICRVFDCLFGHGNSINDDECAKANEVMIFLTQNSIGMKLSLDDLPVGVHYPIDDAIRRFKDRPPMNITAEICRYIGREDLTGIAAVNSNNESSDGLSSSTQLQDKGNSDSGVEHCDESASDGLDEIVTLSQRLFPADRRMKEVARLVRSNRLLCLKLEKQADSSDQDYVQQQQARLLLLCKRSMALPVARGMVTLGGFDLAQAQNHAWRLRVPRLPLAGRTPPTNAVVALDVSGYANELTYWPQFHNGCATGLRLPACDLSNVVNRYWIKYHRPNLADFQLRPTNGATQSTLNETALCEAQSAHAGLLLGLGLRGHLKCLSMADVYNYLSLSNEFVTVAILIGMATTAAHCRKRRKKQYNDGAATTSFAVVDAEVESAFLLDEEQYLPHSQKTSNTPLTGMGLELNLERSVSKMLCLHIPSLLPPPFAEFSVPASTQTAALLGLGILYQSTGHRLMTELLLTEITRSPSSDQFMNNNGSSGLSTSSFDQLEGYVLAAGLALGLVILGRGTKTGGDPGLADLKLDEKLYKYVVGGAQYFGDASASGNCLYRGRKWKSFGGSSGANGNNIASAPTMQAPPSDSTAAGKDPKPTQDGQWKGEHVNIGVTASGSALALAFMYMQTGNTSIAARLAVPDTLILLDQVRPDILLIRTLAKNLVLWEDIAPTSAWIEQQEVPPQLLLAYKALIQRQQNQQQQRRPDMDSNTPPPSAALPPHADTHSICEAYAHIVAGACFSIGLRFAGTADKSARETLGKYVLSFREMRGARSGSPIAMNTDRVTIERCLAVCAQALALVDAGTGNITTLTLLRSLNLRQRIDPELTYGNHMALSMSIGLLFLGGGRATLSRSREAIASLVISLFPVGPMNTADNKYHLQAFRHLYVLAVDTSRLLETVNVESKENCSVNIRLQVQQDHGQKQLTSEEFYTPCLLPSLDSIKRIVIDTNDFYPVEIAMTGSDGSSSMGTANALRAQLLRDKNMILLKRKEAVETWKLSGGGSSGCHLAMQQASTESYSPWMRAFQLYLLHEDDTGDLDCAPNHAETSWWGSVVQMLAQLHYAREDAPTFMPMHLNALHALMRLKRAPLQTMTDIWNMKFFVSAQKLRLVAERRDDLGDSNLNGDYVRWMQNEMEESLRLLWRKSSMVIPSLSAARAHFLHDFSSESQPSRFIMCALIRYFNGPSTPLRRSWMDRLEHILKLCCENKSEHDQYVHFQLTQFVTHEKISTEEKTFWLQLVSFCLFAS